MAAHISALQTSSLSALFWSRVFTPSMLSEVTVSTSCCACPSKRVSWLTSAEPLNSTTTSSTTPCTASFTSFKSELIARCSSSSSSSFSLSVNRSSHLDFFTLAVPTARIRSYTCGYLLMMSLKFPLESSKSSVVPSAYTSAIRSCTNVSAISPKKSPGLRVAISWELTATRHAPLLTKYMLIPIVPCLITRVSGENNNGRSLLAISCISSEPSTELRNNGAFRTSAHVSGSSMRL
mmetsp:Transcript_5323/g.12840  ORF Transcript_5323/g.12840 Transcript_5323/m.12840 type:complete len:236 (+) Transcript_5323:551-1258(+)